MRFDFSFSLQVSGRLQIAAQRLDGALQIAIGQGALGIAGAQRRCANPEISKAHVCEAIALRTGKSRETYDGVIAMPARELGKANAGLCGRARNANGGEHVVRRERRLEQSLEKFIGLDRTRALWTRNLDLAAK